MSQRKATSTEGANSQPRNKGTEQKSLACIAGVGLRLPKANNLDELADLLQKGETSFEETRWQHGLFGMDHTCGRVEPIGEMDCEFFNISPTEAYSSTHMLGPLLEVVAESILDSGLTFDMVSRLTTGFYLGMTLCDTDGLHAGEATFNQGSELSASVAQRFDLHGPVQHVDGACASSFVALHAALLDLHTGRCDLAIVAGSNLVQDPMASLQFAKMNMVSPQGKSLPFDERADGYVRSDGIVAYLLKLSDSLPSREYCDIVAFELQNNGKRKQGITNPNHKFQSKLLGDVYANIDVNDLAYFEAHGTSTQKGDKAELTAIESTLCCIRQNPLVVGSLKGNFGHTEATAGLAGIAKCLAMYKKETIFRMPNFKTPNPTIEALKNGSIIIPTSNIPLSKDPGALLGVSTYGFGGLGGHAVLRRSQGPYGQALTYPVMIPLSLHPAVDLTQSQVDSERKAKQIIMENIKEHIVDQRFLIYLMNSELSKGSINSKRSFLIANPYSGNVCHFNDVSDEGFRKPAPVCLNFADIISPLGYTWIPSPDLMHIPNVNVTLTICNKIVTKFKERTTGRCLEDIETSLWNISPEQPIFTPGALVLKVACQLALINFIKSVSVPDQPFVKSMRSLDFVNTWSGTGTGALAVAYADGCLSLAQCMQVAVVLETFLLEQELKQENTLLQVSLPVYEVYRLGPWVHVLKNLSAESVLISIPKDKLNLFIEQLKELLEELNGSGHDYDDGKRFKNEPFRVLDYSIPIYCNEFSKETKDLKEKLEKIIICPTLWSAKADIEGAKPRGNTNTMCDAEFFTSLLSLQNYEEPFDQHEYSLLGWKESFPKAKCSLSVGIFPEEDLEEDSGEDSWEDLKEDSEEDLKEDSEKYSDFKREIIISCSDSGSYCRRLDQMENQLEMDGHETDLQQYGAETVHYCASGYLNCLGFLHMAGHKIAATNQLIPSGLETRPYTGAFPTHLLWGWTHSGTSQAYDWRHKLTSKPSSAVVSLQFPPESVPVSSVEGAELLDIMLVTVAQHLKEESKDIVLAFSDVSLRPSGNSDQSTSDQGWILSKLYIASQRFVIERVGSYYLTGSFELLHKNPFPEQEVSSEWPALSRVEAGKCPSVVEEMVRLAMGQGAMWPFRLIWDPRRHVRMLSHTSKLTCHLIVQGILTCGGLTLQGPPSQRPPSVPNVSGTPACREESSSGTTTTSDEDLGIEVSHDANIDDMKLGCRTPARLDTPKQVRFSGQIKDAIDKKPSIPLTPGPHSTEKLFHYKTRPKVTPTLLNFDEDDRLIEDSGPCNRRCNLPCLEECSHEEFQTMVAGNCLDSIFFLKSLSLEKDHIETLMSIFYKLPQDTSMHVYITPKGCPCSEAPCVVYISSVTDVHPLLAAESGVSILLRDRSTDLTEECHNLEQCFSIIASSVSGLLTTSHVAQVFAVATSVGPMSMASILEWEPLVMQKEEQLLRKRLEGKMMPASGNVTASVKTCMKTGFDGSVSCERDRDSRFSEYNTRGMTDILKNKTVFTLSIDDNFVQTLSKLMEVNDHIVGLVVPKLSNASSSGSSNTSKLTKDNRKDHHLLKSTTPQRAKQLCDPDSSHPLFLISVLNKIKIEHKQGKLQKKKMQSYVYCKNPKEVLSFKSVYPLVQALTDRCPEVKDTHDVLVSQLSTDENNFDELLFKFWEAHKCSETSELVVRTPAHLIKKTESYLTGASRSSQNLIPEIAVMSPNAVANGNKRSYDLMSALKSPCGPSSPNLKLPKIDMRSKAYRLVKSCKNINSTQAQLDHENKSLEYVGTALSEHQDDVYENKKILEKGCWFEEQCDIPQECRSDQGPSQNSHANHETRKMSKVYFSPVVVSSKETGEPIIPEMGIPVSRQNNNERPRNSSGILKDCSHNKLLENGVKNNNNLIRKKSVTIRVRNMLEESSSEEGVKSIPCHPDSLGTVKEESSGDSFSSFSSSSSWSGTYACSSATITASESGSFQSISGEEGSGAAALYGDARMCGDGGVKSMAVCDPCNRENGIELENTVKHHCQLDGQTNGIEDMKNHQIQTDGHNSDNIHTDHSIAQSCIKLEAKLKKMRDEKQLINAHILGVEAKILKTKAETMKNKAETIKIRTENHNARFSNVDPDSMYHDHITVDNLANRATDIINQGTDSVMVFANTMMMEADSLIATADKMELDCLSNGPAKSMNQSITTDGYCEQNVHTNGNGNKDDQNGHGDANFHNERKHSNVTFKRKTTTEYNFLDSFPDNNPEVEDVQAKVSMALVVQLFDCNVLETPAKGQGEAGRSEGHLLMYVCEDSEGDTYLGLVLMQAEGPPAHSRFRVAPGFTFSHLENALNVILSLHILTRLGRLTPQTVARKTVLVQPPLYKDSGTLALVAHHLGVHRVVSASNLDCVQEDFTLAAPGTVILREKVSTLSVMPHTQGKGADVLVLFHPHDLVEYLSLVGMNGSVVLCGNIDPTQAIGMSVFLRNISVHCVDTQHMVEQVCQMEGEEKLEFESMLADTLMALNDTICNMYPPGLEGYFSRVLAKVLKLDQDHRPCEAQMVHMLGIDVTTSYVQDNNHTQMAVASFITQAMSTPALNEHIIVPSVFSSEPNEVMKNCTGQGESRQVGSVKKLSMKMISETLCKLARRWRRRTLPKLSAVTSMGLDDPSMTPSVRPVKWPTVMEDGNNNNAGEKAGTQEGPMNVLYRRGFEITSGLESVPSQSIKNTLVHLNTCFTGTPLVIVHPILGTVNCLSDLARLLPVPVYGLQFSGSAQVHCKEGIKALARYYLHELEVQGLLGGPLYLSGYSYGTVVAWEMAQHMSHLRPDSLLQLLLLDGSPHYVKTCIEHDLAFVPYPDHQCMDGLSQELKQQRFECGLLMTFVRLHKKLDNSQLAALLMTQTCQEDRLKMAVDLSLGLMEMNVSVSPRTKWRLASTRVVKHLKRAAFRKSVASMRSVHLSCQECQASVSESVTEGLNNMSMTSEGDDQVFNCSINSGAGPHRRMSRQDTLESQLQVCKRKVSSHAAQCRDEMSRLMPELDMAEPVYNARGAGHRMLWALRMHKARVLLDLGLMMMDYKLDTLCGVPCSLVRVKKPPSHLCGDVLDLHYGLQELTCQEKLLIAFVEGNHLSCLQEPFVAHMAGSIRTLLKL